MYQGDTSGSTSSGDTNEDEVDWDALAALVKNLTLIVNDGKISVDVQNHTVAENIKYKTEVKVDEEKPAKVAKYLFGGQGWQLVVDKDYGDTTINVKAEAKQKRHYD